jgi:hypothetical protein
MKSACRSFLVFSVLLIPALLFGGEVEDAGATKSLWDGLEYRLIGP